jgi:hypothetical protein
MATSSTRWSHLLHELNDGTPYSACRAATFSFNQIHRQEEFGRMQAVMPTAPTNRYRSARLLPAKTDTPAGRRGSRRLSAVIPITAPGKISNHCNYQ